MSRAQTKPTDEQFRAAAIRLFQEDGRIEIDERDSIVSRGRERGAYVAAWVWVPIEGIK